MLEDISSNGRPVWKLEEVDEFLYFNGRKYTNIYLNNHN